MPTGPILKEPTYVSLFLFEGKLSSGRQNLCGIVLCVSCSTASRVRSVRSQCLIDSHGERHPEDRLVHTSPSLGNANRGSEPGRELLKVFHPAGCIPRTIYTGLSHTFYLTLETVLRAGYDVLIIQMRKVTLTTVSSTGFLTVSPYPPDLTFLISCPVLQATTQVTRMWRSHSLGHQH